MMAVYFIRNQNWHIKIGTSEDPDRRLRGLQTATTDRLELVRVIDGGGPTERWLHRRYAKRRINGEWFHFDKEMLTIIPPDEIPPEQKQIVAWKSTRSYLLAMNKLGLLTEEMKRTYGIQ